MGDPTTRPLYENPEDAMYTVLITSQLAWATLVLWSKMVMDGTIVTKKVSPYPLNREHPCTEEPIVGGGGET